MLKFWKKKPGDDAAPSDTNTADTPKTDEQVAATKPAWRGGFKKSIFNRDVRDLFARHPKLDDESLLDDLETVLIGADVGVAASTEIVENLRARIRKREFTFPDDVLNALRERLLAILRPVAVPLRTDSANPFVILMVGVNGVGKTTTIGKLARYFQNHGKSVMLAAGDTFRAAAMEQLKTWADRNNVPVIAQGAGADSASVIFDALQAATSRNADILIADTAGRLHTQSGLMDELSKIRRVLAKLDPDAPHEALLVLDGTTGQNAINQTKQFVAAIGVTGLVITKLDGTAKGGVVFALAKEFGVPIRFVGLGETADDLREFDAAAFVDGLLPATLGNA